MSHDFRDTSELNPRASDWNQQGLPSSQRTTRFYSVRFRFYTGILAFVVLVGLPIVGLPVLRHRLQERVQVLQEAVAGINKSQIVLARVGENTDPLPPEYERPIQPIPQVPNIVFPTDRVFRPSTIGQAAGEQPKEVRRREISEPIRNEPVQTAEPAGAESSEPQFRQGKIEQEAYDLLLQANLTVAGLVGGTNPSLKFKTWAAAKIDEDMYYVRLIFFRDSDEASYIWQVKLLSKQVIPLNFNARSLPPK